VTQAGIRVPSSSFGLEFPETIGSSVGGQSPRHAAWQPGVHVPAAKAESSALVEAYRARFRREPAPLSMHGYAAARALVWALEAALPGPHPLSGETVREAMARVDLETPLGRVRFTPQGEPVAYERVVVQVQQGRHVVVYPREAATAPLVHPRP
jgi:branched-chain amino acid transport system substrate-binding protein